MVPVEGISEEELLSIAYALEKKSEHPLAHAILQKAEEAQIHDNLEIKNFWLLLEMGFLEILIKRRSMVETRDLLRNMQNSIIYDQKIRRTC